MKARRVAAEEPFVSLNSRLKDLPGTVSRVIKERKKYPEQNIVEVHERRV